jgi:hypothetical protein
MNNAYTAIVSIVNPRVVCTGRAMHRSPKRAISLAVEIATRKQEALPISEYNVGMEWLTLEQKSQTLVSNPVRTGWDPCTRSYRAEMEKW